MSDESNSLEHWYRVYEQMYAPSLDEFDRPIGSGSVAVIVDKFVVTKTTPKGVWLQQQFGDFLSTGKHFVLRDARRRFACQTREEAFESFRARKRKQISIYRSRINSIEQALSAAEALEKNGDARIKVSRY